MCNVVKEEEYRLSDFSLSPHNIEYIEELYEDWKKNKSSVNKEWQEYFSLFDLEKAAPITASDPSLQHYKQGRVDSLIWAYRDVGYLYAFLNPLVGYLSADLLYLYEQEHGLYETLTLKEFGLKEDDLDTVFSTGRYLKPERAPLRKLIEALRVTYCSSIGVEFLHIQNKQKRNWIIERMESTRGKPSFDNSTKKIILQDLIKAEEFEHLLHSQFIGQKRFSLEGAEVLIPALHFLVNSAVESSIQDIVIGTSHRGRLNVLANILNKPAVEIFSEFEDIYDPDQYGGSGDVKYHRGYQLEHVHEDEKRVLINLVPNPSHLESVDPVVEGIARGLQHKRGDAHKKNVIPLLIHGDAAFSGQGVVAETLNLSQLRGYNTGGTIHIIVNNQIGFTTSTKDARSTFFPTDIGKMLYIPIFHVNGDDPEAVVHTVDLALQFRQRFNCDVIIDIFCYRRHGHNEGDEPSFTHPKMYQLIRYHTSVTKKYAETLDKLGALSIDESKEFAENYRNSVKKVLEIKEKKTNGNLKKKFQPHLPPRRDTGVEQKILEEIAGKISTIPEHFPIHKKLERIVKDRERRFKEGGPFDFSLAEALAFGSLLIEGVHIRLSGEDSARGTFSQRHTVWWDVESTHPISYVPLNNLRSDQAEFAVYDSPLSEFSILGFEYGYAMAQSDALVVWEAQFGDFCNGAQVIIDNYIVSSESKWQSKNGLVMLLPHGYEGQGPEHSSAHLERFLQLSAENNIRVCNPSTPAQYFHLLRDQALGQVKKTLIIMTPKSLLRNRNAVSYLQDFTLGGFQEVIDDQTAQASSHFIAFCSGKIYYDLVKKKSTLDLNNLAIIRIEQLYPFPDKEIEKILNKYKDYRGLYWVQEESKNRGTWSFIQSKFCEISGLKNISYIGRKESASPATGSHSRHIKEQEIILGILDSLKGNIVTSLHTN